MLFNSINFAIFFPIIFILYWFVTNKSLKLQNLLLLLSSYFFYACWDWRFLFLLMFSTSLDYFTGLKISDSNKITSKRFWLWLSIIINLGFLAVFKYYNFFAHSFAEAASNLGFKVSPYTINIILPVGISFYTFHGLSYIIDIYYGRIKAEKNIVEYSVFVSFFPLLVAGPIERATHLLPQIKKERKFDYAQGIDGLRQILWGLFKKVVIADNCAEYANMIFNNSSHYSGSMLIVGAFFFTLQIYGDFSGYSDIALGVARLLGIELLKNFAFPYFSRNIAEFWRRWHISLSSWFKDYLYIPLGGSKGGTAMRIRNTLIIFIVSGFWHGANWTFIVWGFLNALFIMPSIIRSTNRNSIEIVAKGQILPSVKDAISIFATFCLTMFAWIFFRAESITHAFKYIAGIFSPSVFTIPKVSDLGHNAIAIILLTFFLLLVEWIGREGKFALSHINKMPVAFRWIFYFTIILLLFIYTGKEQPFIYFQF